MSKSKSRFMVRLKAVRDDRAYLRLKSGYGKKSEALWFSKEVAIKKADALNQKMQSNGYNIVHAVIEEV